jgi:hypothetical protein
MVSVNELIALEINMYVGYCQKAAEHDENEYLYRKLAHVVFYHIQELRTTGKPTFAGKVIQPISNK